MARQLGVMDPLLRKTGYRRSTIVGGVSSNWKTSLSKFIRAQIGMEAAFRDRRHAGEALGQELLNRLSEEDRRNAVVLGLVRGGLPVAEPVAVALDAQLDAFVSRKIGAPLQPEYGIGAIAEGGEFIINQEAAHAVGATAAQVEQIVAREAQELQRRIQVYRQGRQHLPVTGKVVVVVDDGLATGVTARAALKGLRAQGAGRLVLAVPVGSAHTMKELAGSTLADDVVCLMTPTHFRAVGQWYDDFRQTTDEEVVEILARHPHAETPLAAAAAAAGPSAPPKAKHATKHPAAAAPAGTSDLSDTAAASDQAPTAAGAAATPEVVASASTDRPSMLPTAGAEEVVITDSATGMLLHGTLTVPPSPKGLVLFAHGSGSGRHSPRNRQVATTLNESGFATLLFDLLSVAEAEDRSKVFDIPLLASRLQLAVGWLLDSKMLPAEFPVGFFGASTGGGAALWAAANLQGCRNFQVKAVVVRGGRPDLAADKLPAVKAPTLLLVGGADTRVLQLNQVALSVIGSGASSALKVVPGAGHLFEGPGQLEKVAEHAVQWFKQHMTGQ